MGSPQAQSGKEAARILNLEPGQATTLTTEDPERLLDAVNRLAQQGNGPYRVVIEGSTACVTRTSKT